MIATCYISKKDMIGFDFIIVQNIGEKEINQIYNPAADSIMRLKSKAYWQEISAPML